MEPAEEALPSQSNAHQSPSSRPQDTVESSVLPPVASPAVHLSGHRVSEHFQAHLCRMQVEDGCQVCDSACDQDSNFLSFNQPATVLKQAIPRLASCLSLALLRRRLEPNSPCLMEDTDVTCSGFFCCQKSARQSDYNRRHSRNSRRSRLRARYCRWRENANADQ